LTSTSSPIYILTGERGSGKSTVCARVVDLARERGMSVAGILTESAAAHGRLPPDASSSRVATDLATSERRLFGERGPIGVSLASSGGHTRSDPLTPGWHFDTGIFEWGNDVLERAAGCDLLVVDEIGPLQLLGGRGWSAAVDVLRSAERSAAELRRVSGGS
jgi:nucleoside-triphosphatase THEP1